MAWLHEIGLDVKIPHLNRAERGDYRAYYTPQARERVAWLFERDIQFMGYVF